VGIEGRRARISTAANMATTPPSLFGMERKMVYAHKKYHSGLIWRGVDRGLARIKFSGSRKVYGNQRMILVIIKKMAENPRRSLAV